MDEFQLSYTAQDINKKLGKIDSKLDSNRLPDAINQALAQAKARGEFDGKDGYTPVKGVDYFDGEDGYTPQKGIDYFDGEPGAPGKDGQDGSDGYTPIKGTDYFDGEPGKDGYTPVKGVDYYTDAEKQEMATDVLTLINDNLDSLLPELNLGSGLPEVSTSNNGNVLAVVNGVWQSVTPEFPEELPAVSAADNGKVLAVVNGQWNTAVPGVSGGQSEIPVFNLADMGLPVVTLPEGEFLIETDTSEIVEALEKGEVKFAIPVSLSNVAFTANMIMQAFTDGSLYQCTSVLMVNDLLLFVMVIVNEYMVVVRVNPFTNFIDSYIRAALEGDYGW